MLRIDKPGIYEMSSDDYHSDPCPQPSLSSSICKLLINATPQHAWDEHPRLNPNHEHEEAEKFDLGNAAHSLMLSDPKAFAIIDATDWRTKEAKEKRDKARADGKIPMLAHQWERVQHMVDVGRLQLLNHDDAKDAFANGKPEQTLIWQEGEVWCRARLDWLPNEGHVFDDYKSSETADPDAWRRIVESVGHDIQAAFYRRGIKALGLAKNPVFRFIVQENSSPFALSAIQLAPAFLELGDRRVASALETWRWCTKNGAWPGYVRKTVTIEPSQFHESRLMEREVRDEDFRREHPDKHLLELGMRMQAPL